MGRLPPKLLCNTSTLLNFLIHLAICISVKLLLDLAIKKPSLLFLSSTSRLIVVKIIISDRR